MKKNIYIFFNIELNFYIECSYVYVLCETNPDTCDNNTMTGIQVVTKIFKLSKKYEKKLLLKFLAIYKTKNVH